MAAPSVVPSIIRSIILLGIVALFLYFTGKWILWLFSGSDEQRTAVQMQVEDNGTVSVSLEGGLLQRAEDTLKLYAGDRVTTGGNGHALLSFFDGSAARTDVQSDMTIDESSQGAENSEYEMTVTQGAIWISTPDMTTFSGSIVRTVHMPRYTATLPSDSEVVLESNAVTVFSADGAGVELTIGNADPVFVGEGQQLTLPEGEIAGDPLQYRSAIEPLSVQRDFIEESRTVVVTQSGSTTLPVSGDEMLTITTPADRTTVATATVRVEGTVAPRVERVRVNGYETTINRSNNSFSQELSLKENADTTITIDALDARGISLAQETRTVRRGTQAINIPTITSPAKNGETYRTSKTEFSITGTAPAGAAGIMVNEYKLQLFRAGNTTWSYLASTALNNLKSGTNVYNVYTLDAQGQKSEPATITIIVEAGATDGVVSGGTTGSASSSAPVIDESTLPKNDPLMPGTLSVTGPAAGTSFTATGSEFLLEGTTPKETVNVWVNGYRLQLFTAGKTYWNYIAKTDYGTLKRGTNTYTITARNAQNQIIDTFVYTVEYNP